MSDDHEDSDTREIEHEQNLSREEVADYLESVVEGLRGDESLSLTIGDETVEVSPADRIEFEVEYEQEGDERELEFELEWTEGGGELEVGGED